eukprot:SM001375S00007  [mRNA]  locus=s1375:41:1469:+ [translate_table: standard]
MLIPDKDVVEIEPRNLTSENPINPRVDMQLLLVVLGEGLQYRSASLYLCIRVCLKLRSLGYVCFQRSPAGMFPLIRVTTYQNGCALSSCLEQWKRLRTRLIELADEHVIERTYTYQRDEDETVDLVLEGMAPSDKPNTKQAASTVCHEYEVTKASVSWVRKGSGSKSEMKWTMYVFALLSSQLEGAQDDFVVCKLHYAFKEGSPSITSKLEHLDGRLPERSPLAEKCPICNSQSLGRKSLDHWRRSWNPADINDCGQRWQNRPVFRDLSLVL